MSNSKLLLFSLLFNLLAILAGVFLIYKLGGIKYLKYKLQKRGVGTLVDDRKSLFEVLPSDTASIVFLGNSLTNYGNWSELLDNPNIKNRGIPGDVTSGILSRINQLKDLNPKKIFLMIGINDLLFKNPSDILNNYYKIVEQLQAQFPNTELYIQSVLPVSNKIKVVPIENESVQELNEGLKKMCQEQQLTYIDMYGAFLGENRELDAKYTNDGVHLTGQGYLLWKSFVEKYVN